MAELKTKMNDTDPMEFLLQVENDKRREDSIKLLQIMKNLTKEQPKMWGPSIIGFGKMEYKNTSGTHDWMMTGFSPRKQNLTIYIMDGFTMYEQLLSKLGKHKLGKSCLYINKLEDIDIDILEELISKSIEYIKSKKPISY
ncbi:DUF1801 domain-containing protein [Vallitalea guaymasensis]|uniref:DUF1801 domain-containing protein n=2 Tax=Vallitalea guaymasensis TaxID=1185412 RepID=A0A8J8MFT1_9FIRM|nr:DUF1801 domain-containing protein [Vallitalea guaymasensis]QUH31845.1 DUF1801 domain-containing protein [Vallitalea guaymasensis]